jgi:putative lipoic acid-binding regulatory protein
MDEEKMKQLKKVLDEQNQWPAIFMFKFIIPTDDAKLITLKKIFGESAEIKTRLSGKGNYTSVTVKEMMLDADSIFERYRSAADIEGIISL